jgi:hypothetical protein
MYTTTFFLSKEAHGLDENTLACIKKFPSFQTFSNLISQSR